MNPTPNIVEKMFGNLINNSMLHCQKEVKLGLF